MLWESKTKTVRHTPRQYRTFFTLIRTEIEPGTLQLATLRKPVCKPREQRGRRFIYYVYCKLRYCKNVDRRKDLTNYNIPYYWLGRGLSTHRIVKDVTSTNPYINSSNIKMEYYQTHNWKSHCGITLKFNKNNIVPT